jgi:hypothetical protein
VQNIWWGYKKEKFIFSLQAVGCGFFGELMRQTPFIFFPQPATSLKIERRNGKCLEK